MAGFGVTTEDWSDRRCVWTRLWFAGELVLGNGNDRASLYWNDYWIGRSTVLPTQWH